MGGPLTDARGDPYHLRRLAHRSHSSGVQGFAETSQVKCVAVIPGVSRLESDAAQFAKREPYLCVTTADHLLRAREHALCRNTFGGVGKVRL